MLIWMISNNAFRYGVGYTLTIAKTVGCDTDKIAAIVTASIKGAQVNHAPCVVVWPCGATGLTQ
jgi:tRNA splicing ligase